MKFPDITNFLMFASFSSELCPILRVVILISKMVRPHGADLRSQKTDLRPEGM